MEKGEEIKEKFRLYSKISFCFFRKRGNKGNKKIQKIKCKLIEQNKKIISFCKYIYL